MPATRPAKREKRNAVEAIDHAGAELVRAPDPSLPRKRGEVKTVRASVCRRFCLSGLPVPVPPDDVFSRNGSSPTLFVPSLCAPLLPLLLSIHPPAAASSPPSSLVLTLRYCRAPTSPLAPSP